MRLPSSIARAACGVLLASSLVVPRAARADERVQCAEAAEAGQTRRDEADLVGARELFVSCARAQCPIAVQRSCAAWLDDVEQRLPSVVVTLSDSEGHDVIGARAIIDGKEQKRPLDGTAIALNPGVHEVAVVSPAGQRQAMTVLVKEGEKARPITVRAPGAPKPAGPADAEARGPLPWPIFVFAGVSAVGFVTYGLLDADAHAQYREYQQTCSPTCTDEKLSSLRQKITFSDIGLGIGIGAAAIAVGWTVYHFVARPSAAAPVSLRAYEVRF